VRGKQTDRRIAHDRQPRLVESSFGGMTVDDAAYERLVRLHSQKRQSAEAAEGLASFAGKRAANWRAMKG
jgi:methylglutaconyl-CoA hydratase